LNKARGRAGVAERVEHPSSGSYPEPVEVVSDQMRRVGEDEPIPVVGRKSLHGNLVERTVLHVFGVDVGAALVVALPLAALLLVLYGVYYLTTRKDEVIFREALFNWPMVCIAAFALVFALAT
jgi:hypothetical protein